MAANPARVDNTVRALGARGSRQPLSASGSASDLNPTAAAVLAAVPAWWAVQAERAGLEGDWLEVEKAIAALPPCPVPTRPPLEDTWGDLTGEQVGQAYVEALSRETRAAHGRHYTPAPLAGHLWDMAARGAGLSPSDPLAGLVRDPACGSAALLLPALRHHLKAVSDLEPRLVLARLPSLIEGWDLDLAAVWIANVVLAAQMLDTLARVPAAKRRPLPALAHVGDGLASDRALARIIVMNPPYGRVHLSTADKERFAEILFGHANLYAVFMAAGELQLDDRGVLAALVPTSWTAGRYFTPLRERLARTTSLLELGFVASRSGVFSGVLQETCLAAFTRRHQTTTAITRIEGGDQRPVAQVPTPTGGEPWVLPRHAETASVAAGAAALPETLASLGWQVSTGPLVWNRRKADLHARRDAQRVRVLWAGDIDSARVQQDPRRDNMRYLSLASERDRAVNVLNEPAVLVQRTSAPESPRKLVAAPLGQDILNPTGGVVVENHVNILRPRTSAVPIDLMARILGTETMDRLVRCVSGSVALSAYELSALPMPEESTLLAWAALGDQALEAAVAAAYTLEEAT